MKMNTLYQIYIYNTCSRLIVSVAEDRITHSPGIKGLDCCDDESDEQPRGVMLSGFFKDN